MIRTSASCRGPLLSQRRNCRRKRLSGSCLLIVSGAASQGSFGVPREEPVQGGPVQHGEYRPVTERSGGALGLLLYRRGACGSPGGGGASGGVRPTPLEAAGSPAVLPSSAPSVSSAGSDYRARIGSVSMRSTHSTRAPARGPGTGRPASSTRGSAVRPANRRETANFSHR